jgi:hypothetical protein
MKLDPEVVRIRRFQEHRAGRVSEQHTGVAVL